MRPASSLITVLLCIAAMSFESACASLPEIPIGLAQGLLSGEVTEESVILQSRLTTGGRDERGEIAGTAGVGRFEISASADFDDSIWTDWLSANADADYIVKVKVGGLTPATDYFYRLHFGADSATVTVSDAARFRSPLRT